MELWTKNHAVTILPAMAVFLIISMILRKWLGKKDLKIRIIPLQIISVILLLLEVGKQAVSLSKGYDLYHIPLHFCSLFLLVLPAMSFYRGKYANQVRAIGTAVCGAAFWLILIYPVLIYSSGNIDNFFINYLDFHTVAFHNLILLAFLLILFLDLHTPAPKGEVKTIVIFLSVFCGIAAIFSHILQTNYAGFYMCNVPIVESFRLSLHPVIGYVPTQILYFVLLTLVHFGFVSGFYAIYRCLHKLMNKAPSLVG